MYMDIVKKTLRFGCGLENDMVDVIDSFEVCDTLIFSYYNCGCNEDFEFFYVYNSC